MKNFISIFGIALSVLSPMTLSAGMDFHEDIFGFEYEATLVDGDPISAASGSYLNQWSFLNLGGPMDLRFDLFYIPELYNHYPAGFSNHMDVDAYYGVFASNHHIEMFEVTKDDGSRFAKIVFGDQDETLAYDSASGIFKSMGDTAYRLKMVGDYYYLMDPKNERIYMFVPFDEPVNGPHAITWRGRVETIVDRCGNQLNYSYTQDGQFLLASVNDGLGRQLNYSYFPGSERVESVTDSYGRAVSFTAAAVSYGSITDPMGNTTTFEYSTEEYQERLITKINLPLGNFHILQEWGGTPRGNHFYGVQNQQDAFGNQTSLLYAANDDGLNNVTFQYPDGTTTNAPHINNRYPTAVTDQVGSTAILAYNSDCKLSNLTDRQGDSTALTWHTESGKLASITNPEGQTLTFTYEAQVQTFTNPVNGDTVEFTFYNLSQLSGPGGSVDQYTYDSNGKVLTHTDSLGATWAFSYNAMGLPTAVTLPSLEDQYVGEPAGVLQYIWNPDGTLADATDSGMEGTHFFQYDEWKRLVRTGFAPNDPESESTFTDTTYDVLDRVTSITDALGNTWQYQYDANGNLIQVTDPNLSIATLSYDAMDRLVTTTDRLGATTTVSYDWAGRMTSNTDPNGISRYFAYDARGLLQSVTTNGEMKARAYDLEGITTSVTSPLGNVTSQQTNKLGYPIGFTMPNGETTLLERDDRSRITSITDPLGNQTSFRYDVLDRLTSVSLPDESTATYVWDDLGDLQTLTDLNQNVWRFSRSSEGRLLGLTDPLGGSTELSYDVQGRPSVITYADASTNAFSYDAIGRKVGEIYSDGTNLNFDWDASDNLISTNDLVLSYDHEGRITSSTNAVHTISVSYDAGGRVSTVTYGDLLTVTYEYDASNRLSLVSDNLENSVILVHNAEGRLTDVGRSNGIYAAYAYNANGQITQLIDGSLINMSYQYDANGQVTAMSGTAPLNPGAFLEDQEQNLEFDAASQVSSEGYASDERGRSTELAGKALTWDGATRLSGYGSDTTFTWNGLHELTARLVDETTTHYVHNHGFAGNPICMEHTGAQVKRLYVYTPGGKLLYNIDPTNANAVRFYHPDHLGSTLALSDNAGNQTDSYAYDPYGTLLAHEGSSDQPFTFVGTSGVRQDGDLYQMGRRFYDPTTARFLSREPLWPQLGSPAKLNPYQYAIGNPIKYVDPTGYAPNTNGPLGSVGSNAGKLAGEGVEGAKYTGKPWETANLVSYREREAFLKNNPEVSEQVRVYYEIDTQLQRAIFDNDKINPDKFAFDMFTGNFARELIKEMLTGALAYLEDRMNGQLSDEELWILRNELAKKEREFYKKVIEDKKEVNAQLKRIIGLKSSSKKHLRTLLRRAQKEGDRSEQRRILQALMLKANSEGNALESQLIGAEINALMGIEK